LPVIPALDKLRKKDHEFEASLDNIVKHYLKKIKAKRAKWLS
jgi:hypothetical protein